MSSFRIDIMFIISMAIISEQIKDEKESGKNEIDLFSESSHLWALNP